jgi:hypothetical protein
MKRESGYYWVRFYDEWEVARYYSESKEWQLTGADRHFSDNSLNEIDERKIERL